MLSKEEEKKEKEKEAMIVLFDSISQTLHKHIKDDHFDQDSYSQIDSILNENLEDFGDGKHYYFNIEEQQNQNQKYRNIPRLKILFLVNKDQEINMNSWKKICNKYYNKELLNAE